MTLRELREQAMYTQVEVAKFVGVGRSTVSLWESGDRSPRIDHLRKLSQLYNVPPQVIKDAVEATQHNDDSQNQE
jgi:transcriptional regulator with XRE-family HTH domain